MLNIVSESKVKYDVLDSELFEETLETRIVLLIVHTIKIRDTSEQPEQVTGAYPQA